MANPFRDSLLSNQKGVVLVITLVLLTSISFMASLLYLRAAENRRISILLQKRQIAEEFLPPFTEKVLVLIGRYQEKYGFLPREISFAYYAGKTLGSGRVKIYLSAENERLNLNTASDEELLDFLVDLGIPEEEALILRDSLLDWRDKDDVPRPHGAEKDWYRDYTPRNGPLKSFSELLLVRGFNPYYLWFDPGLFDAVTLYADKNQKKMISRAFEDEEKFHLVRGEYYRLDLRAKILPRGPVWRYTVVFRWENPPHILFDLLR